jgi:hypothetical protein
MSVETTDNKPKPGLSSTAKECCWQVSVFTGFALAGWFLWLSLQPVGDDEIKRYAAESPCLQKGMASLLDRDEVVTGKAMFFVKQDCEKEQDEKDRESVIDRQSNALHH